MVASQLKRGESLESPCVGQAESDRNEIVVTIGCTDSSVWEGKKNTA